MLHARGKVVRCGYKGGKKRVGAVENPPEAILAKRSNEADPLSNCDSLNNLDDAEVAIEPAVDLSMKMDKVIKHLASPSSGK